MILCFIFQFRILKINYSESKIKMKQSSLVFKDLKNLKRSSTILSHSIGKDIINSAKDIKNVRSTKQIDITTFMENKNDKIKNIDQKLEAHQSQIAKNNHLIEELSHNFMCLKEQLEKEREISAHEERKNKLLREEIERTNKILRVKNSKIQEVTRKVAQLEKENENLKVTASKCDEYAKSVASLRSKLVQSEQNAAQLRSAFNEKQKDLQRQKEKINTFETLKAKEDDLNSQLLMKDVQIGNLKQAINELHQEKNKEVNEKNVYQRKIQRLNQQIETYKASQKSLNNTIAALERKQHQGRSQLQTLKNEMKSGDSKLRQRQKEESVLRRQCSQLRQKLNNTSSKIDESAKQLGKKDVKIQKLTQKIKDLQNTMGDSHKDKQKLRHFQDKITALKKRGQNLQTVYYSIVPQIQCPFGHQLKNPITIIPCGHNYCLGCKKGYQKQCMQCAGKLKIEAVYRNELMDDIIGMVGGIKQVMELLK